MTDHIDKDSRFHVVEGSVAHERVDGEVIAISMIRGHYFSMSGPAADVWTLVSQELSLEQVLSALDNAYSGPVAHDEVTAFVAVLVEAELLEALPSGQAQDSFDALPDDFDRGLWATPSLEKFEDLEDLILLDPIHDTNRLGWPHVSDADG